MDNVREILVGKGSEKSALTKRAYESEKSALTKHAYESEKRAYKARLRICAGLGSEFRIDADCADKNGDKTLHTFNRFMPKTLHTRFQPRKMIDGIVIYDKLIT